MTSAIEKDKRHIWHPYTQHQTERDPVVITRAQGSCLYDENGKEYLDLISSWWTCVHGHNHPAINKALQEQAQTLEHVMFAGFTHPPAIELAEKLAHRLPGNLNRVFFSDNGSTAVEVALKLAYQYWQNKGQSGRKLFVTFESAYHGDTMGAMSLGKSVGFFTLYQDLMFETRSIPFPETWEGHNTTQQQEKEQEALQAFAKLMEEEGSNIAALIVEPLMQGAAGIRLCRPEFIEQLTIAAQKADIPVIFDEVATGFGRTGSLFACDQIEATPDLVCLSKGLTAGYMALSVTVATDRLYNEFLAPDFKKAFAHGHSFTANPLACAVARQSLALFETENTLQKISDIEQKHREQLPRLQTLETICKPRVMGPVLAFNLTQDRGGYKSTAGEELRDWFLKNGLNIRPLGNVVYIMPPYSITDEQLEQAYEKIYEGLKIIIKK